MVRDHELGADMRRAECQSLEEFIGLDVDLESILFVRGMVYEDAGSEYHFNLSYTGDPSFGVFCDDTTVYGSEGHDDILKRLSGCIGSEIGSDGTAKLGSPGSKEQIANIVKGIFEEFNKPDEYGYVIVDYRP